MPLEVTIQADGFITGALSNAAAWPIWEAIRYCRPERGRRNAARQGEASLAVAAE